MERFWHLSAWLSRAALAVAILDFGIPAYASMIAPVTVAWNEGVGTWTTSAITTLRVHTAAYPVVIVLFCIYCFLAPQRFAAGLGAVLAVSAAALVGRGAGLWIDGMNPRALLLADRQLTAVAIYALAFAIEWQRRTHQETPKLVTPG